MLKVIFTALAVAVSSSAVAGQGPMKNFDVESCDRVGQMAGEFFELFMEAGKPFDYTEATNLANKGALKSYLKEGSKATMAQVEDVLATSWLVKNAHILNQSHEYYLLTQGYPLLAAQSLATNAMKGMCYRQLAVGYEELLKKGKK